MKRFLALLAPMTLIACSHADPAARFADAKAAFAAEDYVKAREAVLDALSGDAGNRDMLLLLVNADLALGDGQSAGRTLSQLANAGMQGLDWNRLSAQAALLRGQPGDMDRLLGSDQSPVAWRLRGEAALASGNTVTALRDFQQGMAAGRTFASAGTMPACCSMPTTSAVRSAVWQSCVRPGAIVSIP